MTDEDQSPDIPDKYVQEVRDSEKQQRRMMSQLERQSKREDGIDKQLNAVSSYVDDELAAIKREVLHINVEDTSEIDDVLPQQGPQGLPGQQGFDGYDGEVGLTGPNGLRGPPGPQGLEGQRGPEGSQGPRGPEGLKGVPGFHGDGGTPGYVGNDGLEGAEGRATDWKMTGGECARGATATMKLTDCNKKACRLETLYNGQWGSVCGENWGKRNTRTICKALGFPGCDVHELHACIHAKMCGFVCTASPHAGALRVLFSDSSSLAIARLDWSPSLPPSLSLSLSLLLSLSVCVCVACACEHQVWRAPEALHVWPYVYGISLLIKTCAYVDCGVM